jgi:hypothetical protein
VTSKEIEMELEKECEENAKKAMEFEGLYDKLQREHDKLL